MQYNFTINAGGRLVSLDRPVVMGILNVTPDSFFADSRCQSADEIRQRIRQIRDEGATIIDIGACSTRPGADMVSAQEEQARLLPAIQMVKSEWPEAIISVDTFRASIAREAIEAGAHVINDISGSNMDPDMFQTVADLHVPYVLTHALKEPTEGDIMTEVFRTLGERVEQLHEMGVADIIIDPGFGFGKTLDQNFTLLRRLEEFHLLGCPLLVGFSRKSMICQTLGISPEEALNGTTVLNSIALMHGAHILRVHDVREAVQACTLTSNL